MIDDRLLALKFSPPSPPPRYVQRPRLASRVVKGLSGRLILICAPIGFGKTSLLASIAQDWGSYSSTSTATHLAWFTLSSSDNDAAAIMDGLVMAVRRLFPDFGRPVRGFLRGIPDARKQMDILLALFRDELRKSVDGEIAIVLDDFHFITDKAIVDALDSTIRDPESHIKWVISTQSYPKLYLSPLRSRDELLELGEEDLRFTPVEVRELLSAHNGKAVTNEVADDVIRDTGGWPSAVYLMSLIAARDRGTLRFDRLFPTQHGYARIVREVLSGLPRPYREALLRSSLLSCLDLHSCREALGLADAEGFLRVIQEATLPVTKPSGRESPLLFDPLFRSALEKELSGKLPADEYRNLKYKLASYYSATGERDEAIRGFLSVGANEEAAIEMEKALDVQLEQGRLDMALGWLKALPVSIRQRHPSLLIQEARISLARERPDDARALLVAARTELENSGDVVLKARLLGGWAALYIREGRVKDALKTAEAALKLLSDNEPADVAELRLLSSRSLELLGHLQEAFDEGSRGLEAAEQSGNQLAVVRAMLQLGRLAYLRGDYETSLALNGRAVQRSVLLDMEMLSLGSAGGLASLSYLERGQIQEAAVVAARSLETSKQYGETAASVRAGLALSVAGEYLSQREYSREKLSEALTLSSKLVPEAPEHVMAMQVATEILHRQGKGKEALLSAKQALNKAAETTNSVIANRCKLMVAAADMSGLRLPMSLLRIFRLCRNPKQMDNKHWLSGALQLLAVGCWRLRMNRLARASLRKALDLASKGSYFGTPLGLPDNKRLLLLATEGRVLHEQAGNMLGVDSAEAVRILSPLIMSKKPALMQRAREAIAGIEAGAGRAQAVRLLWPGLADSGSSDRAELMICTFGQFKVFVDGEYVEWPSNDARDLAAYLLVNRGRPVEKRAVVENLWPNSEPTSAGVRLNLALYRLRETLGPGYPPVDLRLESRQELLWDGIGCSIDVESFREGIDQVRQRLAAEKRPALSRLTIALLEEVIRLYRGAFIANVDFEWCKPIRAELRSQFLWAARLVVLHYMAVGDWTQAMRFGQRSLVVDPLQEEIVRQMMICHYRIGDRDAVQKQYQDLKWHLARKSGAWLSEETRNLHLQLLGA